MYTKFTHSWLYLNVTLKLQQATALHTEHSPYKQTVNQDKEIFIISQSLTQYYTYI